MFTRLISALVLHLAVAGVVAVIPAEAADCPGSWIVPAVVTYRAFDGAEYQRFAWPGEHLVLLTPTDDLCGATVRDLLVIWDRAYAFYYDATGHAPAFWPNNVINGRITVAVLPDGATCGAGCGYLGFTGIELAQTYFDDTYDRLHDDGLVAGLVFYELGRNFWFYGDQLEYLEEPGQWANVTTAYASFMSMVVATVLGYPGTPSFGQPFEDFRAERFSLVDTYVADSALNWENTVRLERSPPFPGASNLDLLASFLHRIERVHGTEWVLRFWREAALRPVRATTQDAVDNMFLAASAAAGVNLVSVFADVWRWPVSDAARAEAEARFGDPVDVAPYVGTCGNVRVEGTEQCDGSDCCTPACTFAASSDPCIDDGSLCSADTCSGNGTCEHRFAPNPTCRTPAESGAATLRLHAGRHGRRDTLRFVWTQRPSLGRNAFGAPDETPRFDLCLYAGQANATMPVVQMSTTGACGAACWRQGKFRWVYEANRASSGMTRLELLSRGRPGRSRVEVAASEGVPDLPVPSGTTMTVELRSRTGQCLGARFSTALRNGHTRFVARSD